MTAPSHALPHRHTRCAPESFCNTFFIVAFIVQCWILICCFPDNIEWLFTFFNSTAWSPPTPLPCSESQKTLQMQTNIWRMFQCLSPSGAILLPSSPLELTPGSLAVVSPCSNPAGLASPSLSPRASLLLQEARLSVLLLLLPLTTMLNIYLN